MFLLKKSTIFCFLFIKYHQTIVGEGLDPPVANPLHFLTVERDSSKLSGVASYSPTIVWHKIAIQFCFVMADGHLYRMRRRHRNVPKAHFIAQGQLHLRSKHHCRSAATSFFFAKSKKEDPGYCQGPHDGGAGGIRTLGTLITYTRFPIVLVTATSILLHICCLYSVDRCWWALGDLNPGPSGYEPDALTNWAKGPFCFRHLSATGLIIVQLFPKCKPFFEIF